jgi:hypothetical protein
MTVVIVNVVMMLERSREVIEVLERRKVDLCCVHKVHFRGEGCRGFGDGAEKNV